MVEPGTEPDLVLLHETAFSQEAVLLHSRLAEEHIFALVEEAPPEAEGGAPTFEVFVGPDQKGAALEVLRKLRSDLEADRGETSGGAASYETWATRAALRFALLAFVAALGLALLVRLVAAVFR